MGLGGGQRRHAFLLGRLHRRLVIGLNVEAEGAADAVATRGAEDDAAAVTRDRVATERWMAIGAELRSFRRHAAIGARSDEAELPVLPLVEAGGGARTACGRSVGVEQLALGAEE